MGQKESDLVTPSLGIIRNQIFRTLVPEGEIAFIRTLESEMPKDLYERFEEDGDCMAY